MFFMHFKKKGFYITLFENRTLKRIFKSKMDAVRQDGVEGWRKV